MNKNRNHLIKPNFAQVYTKANEILVKSSVINTFPFLPKKLIKEQTNIMCRSFTKALQYGVDITDFGSESAIIIKYHGKAIIFYDSTKPKTHNSFSLLHEMGHYVHAHDFNPTDLDIYAKNEIETNYFAAQLLMPEQLIRELKRRGVNVNNEFLREVFGVSEDAANRRLETLAKTNPEWYSRAEKEFDDVILFKFNKFLDEICPRCNVFDYEDEYRLQQERNSWF